jgi:hypothetical protein
MKTETTLNSIFDASMINPEITVAKAYGIKMNSNNELEAVLIKSHPDIYELLEDLSLDKIYLNYSFLSLVTTGWAAPLGKDGEVEGLPSQHKDKRRVTLVSALDINAKEIYGSIIEFKDTDERVFDFNDATGLLANAISSLV